MRYRSPFASSEFCWVWTCERQSTHGEGRGTYLRDRLHKKGKMGVRQLGEPSKRALVDRGEQSLRVLLREQ